MLSFIKQSNKYQNNGSPLLGKFIVLIMAIVVLSCSTISNLVQPRTSEPIDLENKKILDNNDGNNLSYIGEDGNIWLLVNNNNLKITNFDPKSSDLPISSYYWSPDGTKIAVQANGGVYIFDFAQSNDRYFAGKGSFLAGDFYQYWSPDSQKILMTQDGLETLDLVESTGDGAWSKKTMVEPLPFSLFSEKNIAWLPDSQHFVMSGETDINVDAGKCSGSFSKIKVSIVDIQDGKQEVVYDNWGTSFDVDSNKLVLTGGDEPCSDFPLVYGTETSKMTKFDTAAPNSQMCLGDDRTSNPVFQVASTIDGKQSILLVNTIDLSYEVIEFGEISRLTNFISGCRGYFWSKDGKTLFFNGDLFYGGGIFRVDPSTQLIYPFVGDRSTESQFTFNLQNSQIKDILADGNMLVSGNQNGQVPTLYYLNIQTNQMQRLGNGAFWIEPSYFGQSNNGILAIQAKDIQTQATNTYLIKMNGDIVKIIIDASHPLWRPFSR